MTDTNPLYTSLSVSDADESQVVITGEIPVEAALTYKRQALKSLGANASVDGFRPGKMPEEMIEKRMGEERVWNEIASFAVSDAYPKIVVEKSLKPVGRPQITLTKLVPGNPIGGSMTVGIMPEMTFPDYAAVSKKAIASVTETEEVTDADIDEALLSIRKNHAHAKWHQDNPDTHGHDHDIPETDLPEMNDDFAKTIGDFATVADLKIALKTQVASEKKYKLKEKRRVSIADALVGKTPFAVPPIFIESELGKMTAEFEGNVRRMGIDPMEYLAKVEKTVDQLHAEWRPEAKKRAQLQIIINAIAEKEKVEIDQKQFDREVAHIMEHYSDAKLENVKAYVETMLTNNRVFEILEGEEKAVVADAK